MPFIKRDERILGELARKYDERLEVEKRADKPELFTETIPAAYRLENSIGALLSNDFSKVGAIARFNEDYDPFENIDGYEEYVDAFAYANNDTDKEIIKKQIDQENLDQRILSESGAAGIITTLSAGMLDPIAFIPVGGTLYKTYRTGGSILKGGAVTGFAGMTAATQAEAALHYGQMTRTYGESAVNIAATTFLSGILGAGGTALAKRLDAKGKINLRNLEQNIENDLTLPKPDEPDIFSVNETELPDDSGDILFKIDDAAGAAGMRVTTKAEESILRVAGVEKLVRPSTALVTDPMIHSITSPSLQVRVLAQELAETPFKVSKNAQGHASAVALETELKQGDYDLVLGIKELEEQFIRYRKGKSKKYGDVLKVKFEDVTGSKGSVGKLNFEQFKEEVARALRRSDEHAIPEVSAAARKIRTVIYDKGLAKAQKLDILPENIDTKTAESFLNRKYNTNKIINERTNFRDVVFKWIQKQELEKQGKLEKELLSAKKIKNNTKAIKKLEKEIRFLRNAQQLEFRADEIIDRIISTPNSRVPYEIHFGKGLSPKALGDRPRGSLLERSFDIPDELIEEYLENDVEILMKAYNKTLNTDLAIIEKFGDLELTAQRRQINAEYADLVKKHPDKEKVLNDRREKDLEVIMAIVSRLRGTYGLPANANHGAVRAGKLARDVNFVRLLGQMLYSSVPDVGKVVGIDGFRGIFRSALTPMIKDIKNIKILKEEVKLAGTAADMHLSTRALNLAELTDDFARGSKVERAAGKMAETFGMATLMNPWNSFMKQTSGIIVMQKMINAMRRIDAGKPKKKDIENLAFYGIHEREVKSFLKQINTHGYEKDGITFPNTVDWDDSAMEAVNKFRAAMAKEVDRAIVTPGVGDRPLWFSTELGKTIGQFKSFQFASMQRTTIPLMQERDLNTLQAITTMIGLGMFVYYVKESSAGRKVSDDWEDWLVEGMDRSGVFAWLFDANNIVEKATRGGVGVSALMGKRPMSRYASRNIMAAALGPTFGLVQTGASLAGAVGGEEPWTEQDTRALRRLLPYQNLFYLRHLLNEAEKGINSTLGVKRKK